jgi:hypothetical protein
MQYKIAMHRLTEYLKQAKENGWTLDARSLSNQFGVPFHQVMNAINDSK